MNAEHTLVDDFGRKTVFTGTQLVDDHTDTEDGRKPQWLEVTVWRTEAGNFIVRRTTCYRVVHSSEHCSRLDGYSVRPATHDDTYFCPTCNTHGTAGLGQASRVAVDVHKTASELIEGFRDQNGRYSNLARSILAELAQQDDRVDQAWSVNHVA